MKPILIMCLLMAAGCGVLGPDDGSPAVKLTLSGTMYSPHIEIYYQTGGDWTIPFPTGVHPECVTIVTVDSLPWSVEMYTDSVRVYATSGAGPEELTITASGHVVASDEGAGQPLFCEWYE